MINTPHCEGYILHAQDIDLLAYLMYMDSFQMRSTVMFGLKVSLEVDIKW